MTKTLGLIVCGIFLCLHSYAQNLKPGFDKNEYIALLKVSAQFGDSAYASRIPPEAGYRRIYRSPVLGLDNRWSLWQSNQNTLIISIRGTTQNNISWLENFTQPWCLPKANCNSQKPKSFRTS